MMGFTLQQCIVIIVVIIILIIIIIIINQCFVDHKMQLLYISASIKLPIAFNVFLAMAFHRAKFGRFME